MAIVLGVPNFRIFTVPLLTQRVIIPINQFWALDICCHSISPVVQIGRVNRDNLGIIFLITP